MTIWIPVSERLPDKRGSYLTTRLGIVKRGKLIMAGNPTVMMNLYDEERFPFDESVLAWAEPIPYDPDRPDEVQKL